MGRPSLSALLLSLLSSGACTQDGDGGGEEYPECTPFQWPEMPAWSEGGVDYGACPDPELYFGDDCADEACADSPEAAELVRAFRQAVEARGIADQVEIVSANYEPSIDAYRLDYVAVVDWWRCTGHIGADGAGVPPEEFVDEQLRIDSLPASLPTWETALADLRTCDPASQPDVCRGGWCGGLVGTAGECGEAVVRWSNAPDGPGTECKPASGEACCTPYVD